MGKGAMRCAVASLGNSGAASEFCLLSGAPSPLGWLWIAPPALFLFLRPHSIASHTPMDSDAKALGSLLQSLGSELGTREP